jgi:hypothetical protein
LLTCRLLAAVYPTHIGGPVVVHAVVCRDALD